MRPSRPVCAGEVDTLGCGARCLGLGEPVGTRAGGRSGRHRHSAWSSPDRRGRVISSDGEAHARAEHLRGVGMPKLVRDDTWKAEGVAALMQVIAELNKDRNFASGSCQEPSIGGQRIEGAEEAQAVNEIADEGIDGDHAFGLKLAEGDMNGPLTGPRGAQTVIGEVGAFADAHAGVAEQQEDVSAQIVAAQELLFEELILLGGERSRQGVGRARDIFALQQVSQFRRWSSGPAR